MEADGDEVDGDKSDSEEAIDGQAEADGDDRECNV